MSLLSRVNPDLIIATASVFLFLRLSNWFHIFKKAFFKIRLLVQSDDIVYLHGNSSSQYDIEKRVKDKFTKVRLSFAEISSSIQMLHFINKTTFTPYYESMSIVGFAAIIAYIISDIYHYLFPRTPFSSWIIILSIFGILSIIRCGIHTLILLYKRKFDFQMASSIGLLLTMISFIPYIVNELNLLQLSLHSELYEVANHLYALLPLYSYPPINISIDTIYYILIHFTALSIMVITTIQALSALYTTQIFYFLIWGNMYDHISTIKSFFLWIDFLWPILIALLFLPNIEQLLHQRIFHSMTSFYLIYDLVDKSDTCISNDTCDSNTSTIPLTSKYDIQTLPFPSYMLCIQILVLVLYIVIRLSNIHIYLQGYIHQQIAQLYALIRVFDEAKLSSVVKACRERMKTTRHFMGVFSCMLVTPVVLFLCLIALILRLTPGGLGYMYYFHTRLLPQSSSEIQAFFMNISNPIHDISSVSGTNIEYGNTYNYDYTQLLYDQIHYNHTLSIQQAVFPPYINDAIYELFMGIQVTNTTSPYTPIKSVIQKLSTLSLLPWDLSVIILKKYIAIYCIISTIVSIIFLNYWIIKSYADTSSTRETLT